MVEERHWEQAERNLIKSGLMSAKFYVDDESQTVPQIRMSALRVKREAGRLDLLVIDYLQIMRALGNHRGNTVSVVTEISQSVKALAKELGVPVIILSQLSRSVEQREDKRPILSDLRDSGAIEQDADKVAFLYRDEYYNKDTSQKGIAEVLVAKNRNGPIGTAKLQFIGSRTRFESLGR
jgi:replicative DNA helicase